MMKRVTKWYKVNDDLTLQFNHIEDDWNFRESKPSPIEEEHMEEVSWENYIWAKFFCFMDVDGKVEEFYKDVTYKQVEEIRGLLIKGGRL